MLELTIKVHEIAVDGLPTLEKWDSNADDPYTGRVAFLFDGCIVAGWPLYPEEHPALYHPAAIERRAKGGRGGASMTPAERYRSASSVLWESNLEGGRYAGVTHWVEFPHPWWDVINR